MKEASNVSACVVLYRSGESVLDTVRCLEESTEKPEIFVVDNYCLDGVGAKLAQTWPDVQLLPQKENLGFGRGNNVVLPLLHSRYHLLCNPDVTFPPELIGIALLVNREFRRCAYSAEKAKKSDIYIQYERKIRETFPDAKGVI